MNTNIILLFLDIDNDNNNNKRSHSDDEDEKEHLLDVIFESREGVFFNYSETDMIDEVITFLIGVRIYLYLSYLTNYRIFSWNAI